MSKHSSVSAPACTTIPIHPAAWRCLSEITENTGRNSRAFLPISYFTWPCAPPSFRQLSRDSAVIGLAQAAKRMVPGGNRKTFRLRPAQRANPAKEACTVI